MHCDARACYGQEGRGEETFERTPVSELENQVAECRSVVEACEQRLITQQRAKDKVAGWIRDVEVEQEQAPDMAVVWVGLR